MRARIGRSPTHVRIRRPYRPRVRMLLVAALIIAALIVGVMVLSPG
jgi:hypothetical protein